jgi:hypothetical protein
MFINITATPAIRLAKKTGPPGREIPMAPVTIVRKTIMYREFAQEGGRCHEELAEKRDDEENENERGEQILEPGLVQFAERFAGRCW